MPRARSGAHTPVNEMVRSGLTNGVSDDRRTGEETRRSGDNLTRAEVWRLVDDSNRQWRDAHERQTNAIDRLTEEIKRRFDVKDRGSDEQVEEDRKVALVVHDILARENDRDKAMTKRSAAAAGLVAM